MIEIIYYLDDVRDATALANALGGDAYIIPYDGYLNGLTKESTKIAMICHQAGANHMFSFDGRYQYMPRKYIPGLVIAIRNGVRIVESDASTCHIIRYRYDGEKYNFDALLKFINQ